MHVGLPQSPLEGRAEARHAALALYGFYEGGLLPADERPGAVHDGHGEVEAAPHDPPSEKAARRRLADGYPEPLHGQRILGAHVDDAARRADGVSGDRHPLQNRVRVALQDAPVHERARIPLVRVADQVLLPPGASLAMRHFLPVGKPAPPLPRRPDSVTARMTSSGEAPSRTEERAA